MKVGVIGCGGMGTTHYLSLKVLSSQMDVEVVALADCREEFLQKAAAEFPEARTYTYGMELIERETLDAVHICLPSYLHTEHAVAAMKKGMNVLVEKPVCLTREEGELLLETQKETGVKVMVGQVVRAFDEYRYLKEVYDNKTLGKLKSIVMQRVSGNVRWGFEGWFHDEKKSGSVVLDLHIHDLDFLRYMLIKCLVPHFSDSGWQQDRFQRVALIKSKAFNGFQLTVFGKKHLLQMSVRAKHIFRNYFQLF